jgi:hypothetical protein
MACKRPYPYVLPFRAVSALMGVKAQYAYGKFLFEIFLCYRHNLFLLLLVLGFVVYL